MAVNVPGDLLIILGFAFNILAGIFFFLVARGKNQFESLAFKSYYIFTAVISLAVLYLVYLFFDGAYVVEYVHNYSDSTLSFFYTLSALWGGQEGTYLLWLFFNACLGFIILRKTAQYRNYAMVVYAVVNLFFLFLLMKLSPFRLMNFTPADGAGLNPLLQNPWMVIHPPVIFLGYSMAGVLFAVAMSALINKDYSTWVQKVFPWAAITAFLLAAGNILGGYWAYITLGWGGFWAWDPVENSSFIPWFISLALIHGLIIEKRTGALRKTNILMTSFVFVLVVYGTFLTRSGVLADFSVHSFVDLGINQYLVVFLVLYLLMTVSLFSLNRMNMIIAGILLLAFIITTFFTGSNGIIGALITLYIFGNLLYFIPQLKEFGNEKLSYNIFNKEFVIFGGMTLLFLFSVIVLIWTSLPILTNIFSDNPRAADIMTYNKFATPFAIIYSLLLTVAPFTNYVSFEIKKWQGKLVVFAFVGLIIGSLLFIFVNAPIEVAFVFAVVFTGFAFYLQKKEMLSKLVPAAVAFILTILIAYLAGVRNGEYLLFFGAAAMVVTSNMISIIKHIPSSLKVAGAQISHLGFGLMLIGILSSSAYSTNEQLVIPRGQADNAYNLSVTYNGMEHNMEYPQNKLLLSYKENGKEYQARPQLYYSARLDGIMKKPYVDKKWMYDLYFSPMQVQELNNGEGLVLKKDQPKDLGGYEFTFKSFEMTQHDTLAGMGVLAHIEVRDTNSVKIIKPGVMMKTVGNKSQTIDEPAKFGPNDKYSMSIQQILADQGAIAVMIPGLEDSGPPDRLIIDIAKKPIINLVWIGTTLIMLGALVVFYRRRQEIG